MHSVLSLKIPKYNKNDYSGIITSKCQFPRREEIHFFLLNLEIFLMDDIKNPVGNYSDGIFRQVQLFVIAQPRNG